MNHNSPKDFIENQKKLYRSLEPCYCTAIQDTVHFTATGLSHLLYYRRRPRKFSERVYRAALITHVAEVVSNATTAIKKVDLTISTDQIWVLEHEVKATHKGKKQLIKVILIKRGEGKVEFLSVMSK